MKRFTLPVVSALLVAAFLLPPSARADSLVGYVPGRLLLRLAPGYTPSVAKSAGALAVDDPQLQALVDRYAGKDLAPLYPHARFADKAGAPALDRDWAVDFDPAADLDAAAAAFAALPGIDSAVKDELRRESVALPNDPGLTSQWYLRNINPTQKDIRWLGGWAETRGDSNVIVAVVDSGVDWQHPDLGGPGPDHVNGAVLTNWTEYWGTPGVDDDGNGFVDDVRGWDFVNTSASGWPGEDMTVQDNDPMDFEGHGTGCSGCVAAITNNATGIAGTAGGCKVLAVRVGYLPAGQEIGVVSMSWASQGIIYATDRGAKIINCSWGSSSLLSSAVNYASMNGVILVNAAGNDGNDSPEYLSQNAAVLAVAATDVDDLKTSFSDYGTWVELSAPGEGIYTTWHDHNSGTSTYASVSGTSFSSPITCGALALIWSAHPSWDKNQVRTQLLNTCDDLDAINPAYAGQLGAGRVNLLRALGDHFQEVPAEFTLLADAVNEAAPGDTIAVASSQALSGPWTLSTKELTYLGGWDDGFATRDPVGNPTVITGSGSGPVLTIPNGIGPAVTVDGFRCTGGGGSTLTGIPYTGLFGGGVFAYGDAALRNLDVTGNATGSSTQVGGGGGVLLYDSNAQLTNVHVHGNTSLYGAGVYVFRGSPTLTDCTIEDNTLITDNSSPPLGGGLYVTDGVLTMSGCTVSGHLAADYGGGLYAANSMLTTEVHLDHDVWSGNSAKTRGCGIHIASGSLTMTGDAVTGNFQTPDATFTYGGGVSVASGTAVLDSLDVRDNTAMAGAGVAATSGASLTLTNSLLANNGASIFGGGLLLDTVTGVQADGNTIAANSAAGTGGGVYMMSAGADLANDIIAGNTGGASGAHGVAATSSAVTFACCDVYGNTNQDFSGVTDPTGTNGNVSVDPLFCDATAGDFTLTDTSPCLPAGSGGCGQIGALGQGCTATGVEDGTGQGVPAAFRVDRPFPNPFNPMVTIRFALPRAEHATVRIYDAAGRVVRTLVDKDLAAAVHTVVWRGEDDSGRRLGSGVYFYRVRAGTEVGTGQIALIK